MVQHKGGESFGERSEASKKGLESKKEQRPVQAGKSDVPSGHVTHGKLSREEAGRKGGQGYGEKVSEEKKSDIAHLGGQTSAEKMPQEKRIDAGRKGGQNRGNR